MKMKWSTHLGINTQGDKILVLVILQIWSYSCCKHLVTSDWLRALHKSSAHVMIALDPNKYPFRYDNYFSSSINGASFFQQMIK